MAEHTPGPWHWTDHLSPHLSVYAGGGTGQEVVRLTEPFYRDSKGVGLANARLIAAAPDLLLALKELMAVQDCATDCWCIEVGNPGSCEACQARAAIAKAEGRDA